MFTGTVLRSSSPANCQRPRSAVALKACDPVEVQHVIRHQRPQTARPSSRKQSSLAGAGDVTCPQGALIPSQVGTGIYALNEALVAPDLLELRRITGSGAFVKGYVGMYVCSLPAERIFG